MADNVAITPGVGDTVAADEIAGAKYQRVKLIHGADGVNSGDVSSANGLPVSVVGSSGTLTVSLDPGHELGSIKQINSSVAVYFDRGEPTVKVSSITGSVGVYFDGSEPTIKGITNSVGVYVDSIRQTIGVRVGQIDGTVAVYFSQSAPTVNATGAGGSISVNVVAGGAGGGIAQTQVENDAGVFTDVGYAAADMKMPVEVFGAGGSISVNMVSGAVSVGGTLAVYFDQSEPTVKIKNETSGTIAVKFNSEPTVIASGKDGTTTRPLRSNSDGAVKIYDLTDGTVKISSIASTIGVYVDTVTSTIAVKFNSEPTVISSGKQANTTRPLIVNTDGAIKVYDVVNGTMTVNSGSGTLAVRFSDEPYVVTEGKYGATKIATIHNTDGALKIYDIAQGTVTVNAGTGTLGVKLDAINQTIMARVGQVDGTVAVYFSQSNPKVNLGVDIVNCAHTASVANAGNSVSGSTSGVSVSGVQIVAPEANRVIKVYAFSIMSTAAVNLTSKFTNGSGGSPVELWRVAMISPTGGVAGANLAVTPPGYLFACPSGATLCIVNDNASLIHYSVAYFKESA